MSFRCYDGAEAAAAAGQPLYYRVGVTQAEAEAAWASGGENSSPALCGGAEGEDAVERDVCDAASLD